ncbi:hypothetical protein [Deinococcus wulumuqiensis]|uniref:hypothetical protein n=1 Tax=Deinococcus wulumuqiensis TaxID=980427 RepID=UPI00242CA13B|nr:hypothetical protein [Deinococcus wulumuqiensis]
MTLPLTPGSQLHLALSVCSGAAQSGHALYARACTRARRGGRGLPHPRHFEEQLSLLTLFGLLRRTTQGWQLTPPGETQLDRLGPWNTCLPHLAGRTRGNAVVGEGRGNPAPLSTQTFSGGTYA